MGKRKKPEAEAPVIPAPAVAASTDAIPRIMIAVSVLLVGLAAFQWYELFEVLEGGDVFCKIGETFDCAAVWNSAFAKSVHRETGIPVAGWGVAYGILGVLSSWDLLKKGDRSYLLACRFIAVTGVVASIVLAIVTVQLGVFCLTCIGVYLLVVAFAFLSFKAIATSKKVKAKDIVSSVVGSFVLAFVVALMAGRRTPIEPKTHIPKSKETPTTDDLQGYLKSLSPSVLSAVSSSLDEMKKSKVVDASFYPSRFVAGNPDAPVRFIDFSDIRCGHCKKLDQTMHDLERALPGAFSHESRFFPLDSTCNPDLPAALVDPTGARCAAPKLLYCLEGQPAFWSTRTRLFEAQEQLTRDIVVAIASEGVREPAALLACAESEETAQKLRSDIAYAKGYGIEGTPLLLVNGRRTHPTPAFLFAIVLAKGDPNHPAFATLPPPVPHSH
jgi:serine/threonine-protein kinase